MSDHDQSGAEQHSTLGRDAEVAEQERVARIVTRNHLAVFALALSIAKIEMSTSEDSGSLVAARVAQAGQSKLPFPANDSWLALTGSASTRSGFELNARLKFENRYDNAPRVLPKAVDIPLLGEDEYSRKTLVSSRVRIERPSPAIPTTLTRLGISAIHTPNNNYSRPGFAVLNDVAGPQAFTPLIATLYETSDGTADYSALTEEIADSGNRRTPSDTQVAHFATPYELGVPDFVIDLARRNFTTLAAHIGLLASSQLES